MAEQLAIDESLVERLIVGQFPQWAGLGLTPVASGGTDNALFRLGEDKVVRLPRVGGAAATVATEARWLPRLGPALPLPTPEPLVVGAPTEGYPWTWTVCRWLNGRDAFVQPIADLPHAAEVLAGFLRALWAVDTAGGPPSGAGNHYRGVPLAWLDKGVQDALGRLGDEIDVQAAAGVWDAALATPADEGPGVWLHGDLHPGNLLVTDGRLSAVIDFGLLGVGDPACDLAVAWSVLDPESRPLLKAGLAVDEATWTRGRGWALRNGVGALAFYRTSNPTLAAISRRTITEALAG